MEKDFFRKSVIMANELDVAGKFIYSVINKLNQMVSFEIYRRRFLFSLSFSGGI